MAEGDADTEIAHAAVASSQTCTTTVVGEDTDLLIMLPHHGSEDQFLLQICSDRGKSEKVIHDISQYRMKLGGDTCRYLLFLHAFTRCDSTSRIFSIGKQTAFQKLMTNEKFREIAAVFSYKRRTQAEIAQAGCNAMVILFGGYNNEPVNKMRHRIFLKEGDIC